MSLAWSRILQVVEARAAEARCTGATLGGEITDGQDSSGWVENSTGGVEPGSFVRSTRPRKWSTNDTFASTGTAHIDHVVARGIRQLRLAGAAGVHGYPDGRRLPCQPRRTAPPGSNLSH